MSVTRRLSVRFAVVAATALAYWLLVLSSPLQWMIHDLLQPGDNNNGYSPYSASERCNAVRLHIPTGHCS